MKFNMSTEEFIFTVVSFTSTCGWIAIQFSPAVAMVTAVIVMLVAIVAQKISNMNDLKKKDVDEWEVVKIGTRSLTSYPSCSIGMEMPHIIIRDKHGNLQFWAAYNGDTTDWFEMNGGASGRNANKIETQRLKKIWNEHILTTRFS